MAELHRCMNANTCVVVMNEFLCGCMQLNTTGWCEVMFWVEIILSEKLHLPANVKKITSSLPQGQGHCSTVLQ